MAPVFSNFDKKMMRRCFQLAKKGRAMVHPNPMVGAVIVKDGRIIAEGYHHYFGGPHAEVDAFQNAKENVAGATLYCNLEPCCHTKKKTPPCTPLIISKKIARVVVSNIDPNPEVSGKGLQQLRGAGIEVQAGLLAEEGEELNRFFFVSMREQRPYVTVKVAQSVDGFISAKRDSQTWLTGDKAVRYVHRLRSFHDAVLVGSGTVISDDPQLNVRHVRGKNPKRLVLAPHLQVPLNATVFSDGQARQTVVITSDLAASHKVKALEEAGVTVYRLPGTAEGLLQLNDVIRVLWEEFKIHSLLVEGGQQVFSAFLNTGIWDEWIVVQTPKILGQGVKAFSNIKSTAFVLKKTRRLGDDVALIYGKKKSDKVA